MKSNFSFLEKYWPVLAQIGGAAENYLYSDPNACMYKIGAFAERLVREMMVFEGIPEPSFDNTQANRIRLLKRAGLLPTDIDNTLFALRKSHNDAVHAGANSLDDAKTLLSMTFNLAVWFMQTNGDWDFQAPTYSLPEKPLFSLHFCKVKNATQCKIGSGIPDCGAAPFFQGRKYLPNE